MVWPLYAPFLVVRFIVVLVIIENFGHLVREKERERERVRASHHWLNVSGDCDTSGVFIIY